MLSIEAEDGRGRTPVVPARHSDRVRGGAELDVDARKNGEFGELRRDLRLRAVPREIAARFHVRPELGDRWDREDAPLRSFRTQASHPCDRPPDHGTEVLITRTDEGLARDAGELFPAPVTTGAALLPRAAGDIRRRRGEALDPPERFVVDPCLAHHAERVRAKTPVLQQVKRRELDVDDAVMTSVPHRGDRKLELISEEGIGAKLPEHVRTDEEIRDTEGTPLRIAQHT